MLGSLFRAPGVARAINVSNAQPNNQGVATVHAGSSRRWNDRGHRRRAVGPEVGPGARRKLYEMFYRAIPDARADVLDVVAEGDKVVVVLTAFATTHSRSNGDFPLAGK
jgi:predicted ester cyclase